MESWQAFAQTFAQPPDVLSGGAGWAGAGLLGLVLAWVLLVRIPANDKQTTGLIEHFDEVVDKKDRQIDDQRKEFVATLNSLVGTFREEAGAERAACEGHFRNLAESVKHQSETQSQMFRTLSEQLTAHSERNRQWTELLAKTVKDAQEAQAKAAALARPAGG